MPSRYDREMVVRLAPRLGADYDDLEAQLLVVRWQHPTMPRWKVRLRLVDWWRDHGATPSRYSYAEKGIREVPLGDYAAHEPDVLADRLDLIDALDALDRFTRACVLTVVTGEPLADVGRRFGRSESWACLARKRGLAEMRDVLAA